MLLVVARRVLVDVLRLLTVVRHGGWRSVKGEVRGVERVRDKRRMYSPCACLQLRDAGAGRMGNATHGSMWSWWGGGLYTKILCECTNQGGLAGSTLVWRTINNREHTSDPIQARPCGLPRLIRHHGLALNRNCLFRVAGGGQVTPSSDRTGIRIITTDGRSGRQPDARRRTRREGRGTRGPPRVCAHPTARALFACLFRKLAATGRRAQQATHRGCLRCTAVQFLIFLGHSISASKHNVRSLCSIHKLPSHCLLTNILPFPRRTSGRPSFGATRS